MAGEGLLVAALKIAAGVAIGLPLVLYLAQDSLIFHRQPLEEARRAQILGRYPAVREFTLPAADGTRLHGWLAGSQGAGRAPLVLYFGGNAEEVSWMLEAVGNPERGETPGIAWLLVNYRGYGLSGGAPSEQALVADALALYDHARLLPGVQADRIYALGRSLGSGVAVALASQRPLSGVILVNPYDSLVAMARHYYPYLPVSWMLKHRFDSISRAVALRSPLLCIIGERDEVIPPERGLRLYEAWAGTKRKQLIAGAGHNDVDASPQFWPEIRAFLAVAAR